MSHDRSVATGTPRPFGPAECDSEPHSALDPLDRLGPWRSILSVQEDTDRTPPRARRRSAGPDPWYLWLARDLGRVARWAKGEASIVSASARAAAETTKEVTRSVLRARGEPEDRALDDLLVELTARLVGRDAPAAPPLRTDERFWEMVEELLRWRAASTDEPAPEPGDDGDLEEQGDATGEPFTDAHVAEDPEPSPGRAPESKS